jgi:hypothetical protein
MNLGQKKIDISFLTFWIAVAFFFFIASGEIATRNWQPWKWYVDGYKAAKELLKQSSADHPDLLAISVYSGDGVVRYDAAKAYNGLTLLQGWFPAGLEIRLVDMSGKVVHRWPLDFFRIWKNPSHISVHMIPATKYNTFSQGMWLNRDGSVILDLHGLVKLDKCGNVQWKVARRTHHSVTRDDDGTFWVPAVGDTQNISDDMLLSGVTRKKLAANKKLAGYEDVILHISADGKILEEYSVLRALIDGGFNRELFDVSKISNMDPTHLNDINLVTAELADKIKAGVEEGDLLISLRQLHMLAIVDKGSGKIKWHHTGPWVRQHDPDISVDGRIVVFNNNIPYWQENEANPSPQSNIISYDPASGQTAIVYPKSDEFDFFTEIMGSKQRLKNGNMLIVESMNGRVLEVTGDGDIVWEYIKPYNEQFASLITHAIRYDYNYFSDVNWDCD